MVAQVTPVEQHRINACAANLRAAYDELAQVLNKDSTLIHTQRELMAMVDIVLQYVGPVKKGA